MGGDESNIQEKYISLNQHGKAPNQFVECGHGRTLFEQYMLRLEELDIGS